MLYGTKGHLQMLVPNTFFQRIFQNGGHKTKLLDYLIDSSQNNAHTNHSFFHQLYNVSYNGYEEVNTLSTYYNWTEISIAMYLQKGNVYFSIQISGVRSPILVNKLIDFFITGCRLHYARADKSAGTTLCYFENSQERALEVSVILKITSRKYLTVL